MYFVLMVLEYTMLHFTITQTQHKLFMLGLVSHSQTVNISLQIHRNYSMDLCLP